MNDDYVQKHDTFIQCHTYTVDSFIQCRTHTVTNNTDMIVQMNGPQGIRGKNNGQTAANARWGQSRNFVEKERFSTLS